MTIPTNGQSYRVKKTLFGPLLDYQCPHCSAELKSTLSDAGQNDTCPHCERAFVVPGTVERQQIEARQQVTAATRSEVPDASGRGPWGMAFVAMVLGFAALSLLYLGTLAWFALEPPRGRALADQWPSVICVVLLGLSSAIVAIVLGFIAWGKARRGEAGGKRMAVVGIVLGHVATGIYITLAILGILVFILGVVILLRIAEHGWK